LITRPRKGGPVLSLGWSRKKSSRKKGRGGVPKWFVELQ